MQFAKRLKQFLKKQGEYYLPLWKEETSLLKLHPQLTYKQNEKQLLQTHFVVLLSCVVVLQTSLLP